MQYYNNNQYYKHIKSATLTIAVITQFKTGKKNRFLFNVYINTKYTRIIYYFFKLTFKLTNILTYHAYKV